MRKICLYSLIITSITMTSCYSTLQVRVDALDMAKMKGSSQYQSEEKEKEIAFYNRRLNSTYYAETEAFLSNKVSVFFNADPDFDPSRLTRAMITVDSAIKNNLENLRTREIAVRDALQALQNVQGQPNGDLRTRYDQAFANFEMEKQKMVTYLNELGNTVNIPEASRDIFKKQTEAYAANIIPTGIFGTAITDDRMASFVAKAPEEFWQKYTPNFYDNENILAKSDKKARINRTGITTVIGNSDVAVKMDGPGNFVIKGVRLDADQAFRTSFKVLSQSIQYFAATSGIPLSAPKPATANTVPDTPNTINVPELEGLELNRQASTDIDDRYIELTKSFLAILETNKNALVSPIATRRYAAIKTVKTAYLYYKSQITLK